MSSNGDTLRMALVQFNFKDLHDPSRRFVRRAAPCDTVVAT